MISMPNMKLIIHDFGKHSYLVPPNRTVMGKNNSILLITVILTISSLFGCGDRIEGKKEEEQMKNEIYVSKESFEENFQNQISMSPQTLQKLRSYGVDEYRELKLEFFFYTNLQKKAEALANELKSLGYEVETAASAFADDNTCITGWTTKMKMSETVVVAWTRQMCELGYKHDCEFDGWGTMPDQ